MLSAYWRHPDIQKVINAAREAGRPLPKAVRDLPDIQPHQKLFLLAFQDCCTCRQVGMGLGPIPWTAVKDWCHASGLTPIESEEVWFVVTKMDEAFLTHSVSQMKQANGKNADGVQGRDAKG